MIEATLRLPGLDGGNSLGFLAALGVLRTLDRVWTKDDVRLHWARDTSWQPLIITHRSLSRERLIDALADGLRGMDGHPALGDDPSFPLGDDLKVEAAEFRRYSAEAAHRAAGGDRTWADFAAAFGCDGITSRAGQIEDTALRTMSGAGNQHFLAFMRQLCSVTEAGQLDAALFEPWTYPDEGLSLRWDPEDDRRYAHRWKDPSKDRPKSVRGANRLAVEGLPFFVGVPQDSRLATTGFRGHRADDTYWRWPIWTRPARPEVVRSLLALAEIQTSIPDRARLAAMGIEEIYESQRLTVGKYRNFSPSRPV